ncbi:Serpin_1 [Hexamita inflata]|uniref:Serpin_1 n=1 Tax=Hexamita inflata TaxID=28002 RepID=A0ABP1HGB7_9EUKA
MKIFETFNIIFLNLVIFVEVLTPHHQRKSIQQYYFTQLQYNLIINIYNKVSTLNSKTFIETNEEGTEAAAVTGIMMCFCLMPDEFRAVTCDRPFWFLIVNEVGGVVFATSVV